MKTELTPTDFRPPTNTGSICCRFRNASDELKALGAFLRTHQRNNFEPYFLIEEDNTRWPARQIILDEATLDDMRLRGCFDIDRVRIHAVKEHSAAKISLGLQTTVYPSGVSVLPISGFPRQLISEDGGRTGTYILFPICILLVIPSPPGEKMKFFCSTHSPAVLRGWGDVFLAFSSSFLAGCPCDLFTDHHTARKTAADDRSVLLNSSRHSVGEEIPPIQQQGPILPMEGLSPVAGSPTIAAATAIELPDSPPIGGPAGAGAGTAAPPRELYDDSGSGTGTGTNMTSASSLSGLTSLLNMANMQQPTWAADGGGGGSGALELEGSPPPGSPVSRSPPPRMM